jgi:hypothetical protein
MRRTVKRIGTAAIACFALAMALPLAGCEKNIPVDNPDENPAVFGPKGIIRGVVNYFGPPPCFRNGVVEGQVVLLLFDAANPPPPDGLASTALNFATVPGEKLFANATRPAKGAPGGAGNNQSLCPSINTPPISASIEWSMQQVGAGRFQVRGFYSRQSRWNPLFNFANLALAGDVAGGALQDPRAAIVRYQTVEVGVPVTVSAECARKPAGGDVPCDVQKADAAANKLRIPDTGFIRDGVPVTLGIPLRSNRPFFHVDYAASNSFAAMPPQKDYATDYVGQRKALTAMENATNGFITFPQDHLSTSQSNVICSLDRSPDCDLFQFAQASFPQIRFKYGFPGDRGNIAAPGGADAWIAKNAKPKDPFFADRVRPFYGIDPKEFAEDIPTSGKFVLSRVFDAAGQPEILRDNDTLETLAQIAEIYPSVVLSKLAEDGDGHIALPPRSQIDPIVVIQTITLRDWGAEAPEAFRGKGSMKATSQGEIAGGALTDASGKPDPNHPLAKREGLVEQDGFTALVRPSAVCIYPQDEFRGTLVTPVAKDPNPQNDDVTLVSAEKLLRLRANRVKLVQFGCLPPGYYSINVVYPTGQAWSFPNLSGHCSYTARFEPNEECMTPNINPAAGGFNWLAGYPGQPATGIKGFNPDLGFPLRPLIRSQMLFKTDAEGRIILDGGGQPIPQVVKITTSDRCGQVKSEEEVTCANDAACPHPFKGACIAGKCDVNGDGRITKSKIFINNPINEDISLDVPGGINPASANGKLNTGEDKNGNGKLDLHVPFSCALPRDKWAQLPADLVTK